MVTTTAVVVVFIVQEVEEEQEVEQTLVVVVEELHRQDGVQYHRDLQRYDGVLASKRLTRSVENLRHRRQHYRGRRRNVSHDAATRGRCNGGYSPLYLGGPHMYWSPPTLKSRGTSYVLVPHPF